MADFVIAKVLGFFGLLLLFLEVFISPLTDTPEFFKLFLKYCPKNKAGFGISLFVTIFFRLAGTSPFNTLLFSKGNPLT